MTDHRIESVDQPSVDHQPEGSVPWKLPVGAAILGALLMAAYVVFAIVTGPNEIDAPAPGIDAGFPVGYAPATEDVAFRADVLHASDDGITVFVSSVVRSGVEPQAVQPVRVDSWFATTPAGVVEAVSHYESEGLPGTYSVRFDVVFDFSETILTAVLPGGAEAPIGSVSAP